MNDSFKVVRIDKDGAGADLTYERREIEAAGAILVGRDAATEEEVIRAATDADVILTSEGRISRRVMEALPRLKAVVRYGVGYDTVDVEAATENQVMVVNVPDFCWEEVANHAIMFLLAQSKKLVQLNAMVKAGQWKQAKRALAPMAAIHGETLGIIGCGRIGRTVAKKALCFEMNVIGYDKYLPKEVAESAGITLVGLDELLQRSDYITIHTALTPETYHMIGEAQFKMMKPNATIINTSRGSTIDEAALIRALQQKRILAACLDVFEKEPVDTDNPLLKMDSVTVLPHSASYSDDAFTRLYITVGKEAARIAQGIMPRSIVNQSVKPKIKLEKDS